MRGVFIGFLFWLFALFLFFVVLGGMGLFARPALERSIKRSVAERMELDTSDPFADNDLEQHEIDAQREQQESSPEFRRWAAQSQMRRVTTPTPPRGTQPRPMTDLRSY
jgi:hypothetical protein